MHYCKTVCHKCIYVTYVSMYNKTKGLNQGNFNKGHNSSNNDYCFNYYCYDRRLV